ncbi:hypothetical protein [Chitinophaga sp. YR573]|uniref:hypothetical protein n=1 Tax=Chitinophaga sp. YR573 TaxID=1881040 RepID=UPI00115F9C7D|nr:hypothetical protein [Chitinophaga sp. YR573]
MNKEDIYFLTLLEEGVPASLEIKSLEKYASIFYYPERSEGRIYPASSKPYLFARFWEQFPENKERHFLFIESDMLVYQIPNLPEDENWYWSEAGKYLDTGKFEYLLGCPDSISKAFGFHCFGKGADADFWYQVEKESIDLYIKMIALNLPGNKWICEMRTWMWNAGRKFNNVISPELLFNDGTGPRKHGATLYHQLSSKVFRKRDYTYTEPFDIEIRVDPKFCVYDYLQAIRTAGSIFKINSES